MQNRWSSYSVIVLPGQCLYTSPGTKSSRWRPKGRSCVVIAPDPRSATVRSTSHDARRMVSDTIRRASTGSAHDVAVADDGMLVRAGPVDRRSEEPTSELQSLM